MLNPGDARAGQRPARRLIGRQGHGDRLVASCVGGHGEAAAGGGADDGRCAIAPVNRDARAEPQVRAHARRHGQRRARRIERALAQALRPRPRQHDHRLPHAQAHRAALRAAIEDQLERPDGQQAVPVLGGAGRARDEVPGLLQPAGGGHRQHHRRHQELPSPRRLMVQRDQVRGHGGIDHAGDAGGGQGPVVRAQAGEEAQGVVGHQARPRQGLDPAHAPLDEQAVGQAPWAAGDCPPGRIRRVAPDAGQLQRAAVGHGAVAGPVERQERSIPAPRHPARTGWGAGARPARQLVPVDGDQPLPGPGAGPGLLLLLRGAACRLAMSVVTAGGVRRTCPP